MAGTTSKALGPRVTVLVATKKGSGKGAKEKKLYSYMAKKTAEYFGFKIENNAETTPAKKGGTARTIRGSKGAGSIKVPQSGKGSKKGHVSIPMPSGVTIRDIKNFLRKAKSNKPDQFVSKGGLTIPLADSKSK